MEKIKWNNRYLLRNYSLTLATISTPYGLIVPFLPLENFPKIICLFALLILLSVIYFIKLSSANNLKKINLEIRKEKIQIIFGDIFQEKGLKVIPFNEYFDTIVSSKIISENSLNGKFIKKYFKENITELDKKIQAELKSSKKKPIENKDRLEGKKNKYPIGTTIKLENMDYLVTCFSKFDENDNAYLTKIDYQIFLEEFWKEISRIYSGEDIIIPLIGSGITRIDKNLEPQTFLELIINSLKFSNEVIKNNTIKIILSDSLIEKIDLYKIKNDYIGG